jgi:hypothetical protein
MGEEDSAVRTGSLIQVQDMKTKITGNARSSSAFLSWFCLIRARRRMKAHRGLMFWRNQYLSGEEGEESEGSFKANQLLFHTQRSTSLSNELRLSPTIEIEETLANEFNSLS